jgi:hypothetical protein
MKPILERSYELARSGEHANVDQIKTRLKTEGYGREIVHHLDGPSLKRDLRKLCRANFPPGLGDKPEQVAPSGIDPSAE